MNAAVVGVVMLLSASGKAEILALFGMSVGTSVTVIHYISRIFTPIESLGMEIQTIQSAMAGVKRIDAFLAQPERAIPEERESAVRGDIMLSHVTFGYGEKSVLTDFSMTVKQGEQVTLVGRTGAGKSTVFKLLLGLYPPESGSITIGGVDVSDIADSERRACIGCVEQHFSRVPGTVLDQITLGDARITEEMAKKRRPARRDRRGHRIATGGLRYGVHGGDVLAGRVAAAVHCARCGGKSCCAASRRDHGKSGRRNRGARARSLAPRLQGAHRTFRFAPRLRKPRRTDDRDPAAAGVTGKKALPF